MRFARSTVVGVALAVVLVGAGAAALVIPHLSGTGAHELQITFPSADGLVPGSDALESGAKVGTVSSVEPNQDNTALVTVQISDDHWPLHAGLNVDIRPKSLLGEKYVDLHDGPQTAAVYNAKGPFPAPSTADPVELDQFINSLDPPTRTAIRVLLDDLGAGVAAQGHDLNTAIATGKQNLANLAVTGKTLNNRDPDLDQILVGLDGVLGKITTSDQLNQMSQLITNGQTTLNAIESVQQSFSRQFTDADLALTDLNTALDGAIPSLRSTLDVAPSLIVNLSQETSMLANLGAIATTKSNLSPHGECTSSTVANQPITSVIGATQCSPIWELVKGLLQGPTNAAGAVEESPTGVKNPIFRVCIIGLPPQVGQSGCDDPNGSQSSGFLNGEGAMFASFIQS
jgi:phospholipid/cholesterol/gamma-HCH transport system substrate-binding protein